MTWAALIVGGYLLGSISWGYLIVRLHQGVDVRTVGSGNAGATNVLRASGTLPAVAVLVLDIGKGAAAVAAARALEAPGPIVGMAAVAVVLGHIFPAYFGFRGGKGVATAAGVFLSLSLIPAVLGLAVFLLVVGATRYVGLSSITSVGLFPPLVYLCGRTGWTAEAPEWLLMSAAAIAVVIVYKHRGNIQRLRDGEELKLGQRPRKEAA